MKLFRHWFVPHHTNNYKARFLHASSLAFLAILLLLFQSLVQFFHRTHPEILGIATNITVEDLLRFTNQEREKRGLKPLKLDPLLSKAAREKAEDMFNKDYWAHTAPDGTTPWDFFHQVGYRYLYAGENLAKEFDQSKDVVSAWMASPTHRANILRPDYEDIGFAVVNGELNGQETTLVVQLFGKQQPQLTASRPRQGTVSAPATSAIEMIGGARTLAQSPLIFQKPSVNVFGLAKTISLSLGLVLFAIFIIDGLFLWRRGVVRLSSRNLAHGMLLASLMAAIWFTGIGAIL